MCVFNWNKLPLHGTTSASLPDAFGASLDPANRTKEKLCGTERGKAQTNKTGHDSGEYKNKAMVVSKM
jgi:hypothetical protein